MEKKIIELIQLALEEDGIENDVTTLNLIGKEQMLSGSFIVKATGVVSGIDVAKEVFRQINPKIKMNILKPKEKLRHKKNNTTSSHTRTSSRS